MSCFLFIDCLRIFVEWGVGGWWGGLGLRVGVEGWGWGGGGKEEEHCGSSVGRKDD